MKMAEQTKKTLTFQEAEVQIAKWAEDRDIEFDSELMQYALERSTGWKTDRKNWELDVMSAYDEMDSDWQTIDRSV